MDLEKRLYEALKKHIADPRAPKPDVFKLPPTGAIRETALGKIWMVETAYDEGFMHGRLELSSEIPVSALDILDPSCRQHGFDFRKTAVIDTETTGLAGGTGTYPFIIGIGFWSGSRFIVRQYILRDFFEEPAQLSAFTDDLAPTTCLLTYNGKTFDMPLLRTRYRINRMEIPFTKHTHLDLVHPCRRLYRRHYDSLNLTHLEQKLLGYERVDDVPSHLIPRIYFDYLQNRDDNLLLPILNHNRDDIVSLYLLAQETSRRIDLALANCCDDDLLLLSIGQILFKSGDYQKSKTLLSAIKRQFAPPDVARDSIMLHSLAAKKAHDWDDAVAVWNQMLKSSKFGCYPHIELAKHYEHRVKDYRMALDLTSRAMKLLEFERDLMPYAHYKNAFAALKRRQRRLLRRSGAI